MITALLLTMALTQPCRDIDGDYLKFSIEIGQTFNLKATAFEDEKCEIPYLEFNQYFSVAANLGQNLDLKTEKVTYKILTDEVARALNQIAYCNVSDWKPNDEVNVTGRLCEDFQQRHDNEMYYQIMSLENGLLKFGKTTSKLDGKSPLTRPVEFDSVNYTK